MTRDLDDIKAYLERIRLKGKQIEAIQAHIDWLTESATRITPMLKEDVISFSGSQDRLGDTVAKIADLKKELHETMLAFVDERTRIVQLLNRIENPYHFEVLSKYYMGCKTFAEIAAEMNYSQRWVFELRDKALVEFKQILIQEGVHYGENCIISRGQGANDPKRLQK